MIAIRCALGDRPIRQFEIRQQAEPMDARNYVEAFAQDPAQRLQDFQAKVALVYVWLSPPSSWLGSLSDSCLQSPGAWRAQAGCGCAQPRAQLCVDHEWSA